MMPATGVIWAALPVPALLIAPDNGVERILGCNPAAELFLAASSAALSGEPAFDRLTIDAPMEEAFARTRANRARWPPCRCTTARPSAPPGITSAISNPAANAFPISSTRAPATRHAALRRSPC